MFSYIAEMGDEQNAKPIPPVVGSDPSIQDMPMSTPHIRDPMYCYTVAVGKKPSHASSWVNDAQAVAELLVILSRGEQETLAWENGNCMWTFILGKITRCMTIHD